MFDIDVFMSKCGWIEELENGTELMIAWATQGRTQLVQTQAQIDVSSLASAVDGIQYRLQTITNEGVEKIDRRIEERLKPVCEVLTSKVSSSRGKTGEALYENWVKECIAVSWDTERTSHISHSGDYIHTHYDTKKRVIADVKNYSKTVGSSEVEKLWHDMGAQQIPLGMLVSMTTRIAGHRDIMDIEFRTVNGVNSCMIFLSNAVDYKNLILVGLEMLRAYTSTKCTTFETLREILELIKTLEDTAKKLEKDMTGTITTYRKQIQCQYATIKRIVSDLINPDSQVEQKTQSLMSS